MQFNIRSMLYWTALAAIIIVGFVSGPMAGNLVLTVCVSVVLNVKFMLSRQRSRTVDCSLAVLLTSCLSSVSFSIATAYTQPNDWSLGSILVGFMTGFLFSVMVTLPFYAIAPDRKFKYHGDGTKNRNETSPISSWFGGGG